MSQAVRCKRHCKKVKSTRNDISPICVYVQAKTDYQFTNYYSLFSNLYLQ